MLTQWVDLGCAGILLHASALLSIPKACQPDKPSVIEFPLMWGIGRFQKL